MEILALEWAEVDLDMGFLRLKDSKTGQKIVPIGRSALTLLAKLQETRQNKYVFPGHKEDHYFVGVPKVWRRVREIADLEGVRLHDLRHTFASVGAGSGLGLPVVGKLLGHRDTKTTERYAHIAENPTRVAADKISGDIAKSLMGGGKE